jgi:calcineurin-like phosphoesterase family protein
MTTFFTADSHFGHENILKYEAEARQFANVELMNEYLIDTWNSQVSPSDSVYHLGDFSMKPTIAFDVVPKLNGKITLIAGNHDRCWTGNPSAKRARAAEKLLSEFKNSCFYEVFGSGFLHGVTVGSHKVLLTHLPTEGDHTDEDRFASARPKLARDEVAAICGHVHSTWTHFKKNINVGVDVRGLKLVSEEELDAEISAMVANGEL